MHTRGMGIGARLMLCNILFKVCVTKYSFLRRWDVVVSLKGMVITWYSYVAHGWTYWFRLRQIKETCDF